jgi:hypothetical protein
MGKLRCESYTINLFTSLLYLEHMYRFVICDLLLYSSQNPYIILQINVYYYLILCKFAALLSIGSLNSSTMIMFRILCGVVT